MTRITVATTITDEVTNNDLSRTAIPPPETTLGSVASRAM